MRTHDARSLRVHAGTAWLVAGALVLLMAGGAGAAQTPAQKCAVAKSKAAVKKLSSKMKCHQKALQLGLVVDPLCLAKAEEKFEAAIAKAELPGGCTVTGDAATIEAAVDFCVDSFVALTPAASTTTTTMSGSTTTSTTLSGLCCATDVGGGVERCTMTSSIEACSGLGGVTSPGTCGNAGACTVVPTGPGDCCDLSGSCIVYNNGSTATVCGIVEGTYMSNAVCTVSGCL